MDAKPLHEKLFTDNNEIDEIALHIAGATIRHRNPFEAIEVPRNGQDDLDDAFIEKYVVPFYSISITTDNNELLQQFASTSREVTADIVAKMLGEFDWRPRIVGAFFAAINDYKELDDLLGRHLVKSEVCYAGGGYCLALAILGTPHAKEVLITYLDYYLQRQDLWFDQVDAFCALEHLDPAAAGQFEDRWNVFVADQPNFNLNASRQLFAKELATVARIRNFKPC
jgi:hypothetical protein